MARRRRKPYTSCAVIRIFNAVQKAVEFPFVNSICAFFGKLRANKWFEQATPEKRAALKRDLQPVVDLWAQL